MKAIKKNSASSLVLTILEKTVDGVVRVNDFINNPGYYAYYDGWNYPLNKSALSQAIKRLSDGGFVDQVKVDGDLILKLTESGRFLISDPNIAEWDGKWRIVIFDIPEQKRIIRNLFRRNLKKWGFEQLQKSVWISKMDVYDKVVGYIGELRIEKWVSVIEANRISNLL